MPEGTGDGGTSPYPPYYDPNSPYAYDVEHAMASACESQNVYPDRMQWNWSEHNCFLVPAEPKGPAGPEEPPKVKPVGPQGPQGPKGAPNAPFDLTQLGDKLDELRKLIDGQGQSLSSDILQNVMDAVKGIYEQRDNIVSAITGKAADLASAVQKGERNIEQQVTNLAGNLLPAQLQLLGAAFGSVENVLAAFFNNAADLGDIGQLITDLFSGNLDAIKQHGYEMLQSGMKDALKDFFDDASNSPPVISQNWMVDAFSKGLGDDPIRAWMDSLRSNTDFSSTLTRALMWVTVPLAIVQGMAAPGAQALSQVAFRQNPSTFLDPRTLAEAVIRKLVPDVQATDMALAQGVTADRFAQLQQLSTRWPTPDEVFSAFWRGGIDEEAKEFLLRMNGYGEQGKKLLDVVMPNIPNVQDVLRFLVRDVFIPEFVEAFGMDKEYPMDADVWAAKLGIPHDVMVLHWRAHWQLPSTDQGYEMFQRNQIDEVALRRLLRANGVEPYWRDPLIAIAYAPLRLVDIRRIQKDLNKDRAWLIEQYKFRGNSPANAELMADWTIKYNSKEKKAELKDLTDGLRSTIVNGVVSGAIAESDGQSYLASLGYEQIEIDSYIKLGRMVRADHARQRMIQLMGDLFVKNRRTEQDVTAFLISQSVQQPEIDVLLKEWTIERDLRAPSVADDKERDLTKAEIIESFTDGIITRDVAVSGLLKLKYDPNETEQLLKVAEYKLAKAKVKELASVIERDYMTGKITIDDASAKLDGIVTRASERDALLVTWENKRDSKALDIPLASRQEMLQRGIRTEDQTRADLLHLGANERDVDDLLVLWGAKGAEKKARETAAAAKASATTTKKVVGP